MGLGGPKPFQLSNLDPYRLDNIAGNHVALPPTANKPPTFEEGGEVHYSGHGGDPVYTAGKMLQSPWG